MKHNFSLLIILLLCLGACAGTVKRNKLEKFDDSLRQYNVDLRWGLYREAQQFHVDRDGKRAEIDLDTLAHIHITGYEVKEKIMNEELTGAQVTSEFSFFHDDYGKVKKVEFTHSWWFQPDTKRWFIESEFPVFK